MITAEQRAAAYLRRVVAEHRKAGCPRMPTHRQLSAAAGISPVVVLRALARLKREGFVTAAAGRGIYVAGMTVPDPVIPAAVSPGPRRARWRQAAAQIQKDILNGLYKPGTPVPACKELVHRYGVCFRTLRKALRGLADRRIIEQYNRRYVVPAPITSDPGGTVVLIAAGYPDGSLHQFSPRTREYLMAIESECARSRVALEVVPFARPPLPGGRVALHGKVPAGRHAPLGFVVFQHGLESATLDYLIGGLPAQNVPVAILDEGIGYRLPTSYRRSGMTRVFSIAFSPAAGEDIGRYLWGLNHRAVAFISAHRQAGWSRNRLQGLRNAFENLSGATDRVAVFESSEAPPTVRQIMSRRRTVRSKDMALLLRLRRVGALRSQVELLMRREIMRPMLVPLFEKALARRDITAWVAANDDIALEGLSFCGAGGVAVPDGLSVVGFDDSVEAMMRRLTSYNFNCAASAHALIGHLFAPRRAAPGESLFEPVEIEGYISRKGSCGPARGRHGP